MIPRISLPLVNLFARQLAENSACNPSLMACPPVKALGDTIHVDFTDGTSPFFVEKNNETLVAYDENGANLIISEEGQTPTLSTPFYIMFGRVEVHLRGATHRDIFSTVALQSDNGDELGMDVIGDDVHRFRSDFVSKGVTDKSGQEFHPVKDAQNAFHNYTIDWNVNGTSWYVDGRFVRLLSSAALGYRYPQTPMAVKLVLRTGKNPNRDHEAKTKFIVNYDRAPFMMTVSQVHVQDYSTGDEYRYIDQSGAWQSIEAINGSVTTSYVLPVISDKRAYVLGDEVQLKATPDKDGHDTNTTEATEFNSYHNDSSEAFEDVASSVSLPAFWAGSVVLAVSVSAICIITMLV